jgi:ABC-type oligopeptide transport system substrate-binding subunit
MRTFTQNKFLLALLVVSASFTACYDDREFAAVPKDTFDYSFVEEFDSVSAALSRGWVLKNVSENKGSGIWSQGGLNDPSVTGFPAIPFAAFSLTVVYF